MRYGIIGKNIAYSLSPKIHNYHFLALNINAVYEIIDLTLLKDYSGFNVTIPYKEKIIDYCDELSTEAKEVGAVNCVKVIEGKYFGYNTDTYGFYMLLKKNNLLIDKKKVLIIGAGGAAKAVYYVFNKYTNMQIFVTNRRSEKAYQITKYVILFSDITNILSTFDIVVNCTNVGVQKYESPITIQTIKESSCFIDLNYQKQNAFLDKARTLGAKTINGLEMLIYQAVKSFEIWFNREANIAAIKEILDKEGINDVNS
jgi:shikimate dehydrogenase